MKSSGSNGTPPQICSIAWMQLDETYLLADLFNARSNGVNTLLLILWYVAFRL
jgi:hypothetical protein